MGKVRKVPELSPEALAKQNAERAERRLVAKAYKENQAARVMGLIASEKTYRKETALARDAAFALENGHLGSLEAAKVGPTPEQLSQDVFDHFAVETAKGTAYVITTVKRRDVPVAAKMRMSGVITQDQYQACVWFRTTWEKSGLLGEISSTDYFREVFSSPSPGGRGQITPYQMDICDHIRFIATQMTARHARLLYATVIEDIPLQRAVRVARAFHRHPKEGFQDAVKQLVDAKKDLEEA